MQEHEERATLALAVGALSGLRSVAGPLVIGTARDAGWRPLALLASIEAIADKHPRMPARTTAPALLGRMMAGALAGTAALPSRRAWGAALAAASAVLSTHAAYRLRTLLASRFAEGSVVPGLVEDAIVIATGTWLVRALRGQR
jgi:uncharacterized membrane protein